MNGLRSCAKFAHKFCSHTHALPTCCAALHPTLRDIIEQQLPRWTCTACRARTQRRARGSRRAAAAWVAAPRGLMPTTPAARRVSFSSLLLLQASERPGSVLLRAL